MTVGSSALLVVDVQERLLAAIPDAARVVWNLRRLLDGAKVLGVAAAATEQYPQGLGPTVGELAQRLPPIPSKLSFSCLTCGEIFEEFRGRGISTILVGGVETHVCIQQTVLDLLAAGWRVQVAADGVASRRAIDHDTALRRMDAAGATLTTTEAALWEWCRVAGTPEFKLISRLAREPDPQDVAKEN
jgi:nicotinamidase-related amidase